MTTKNEATSGCHSFRLRNVPATLVQNNDEDKNSKRSNWDKVTLFYTVP